MPRDTPLTADPPHQRAAGSLEISFRRDPRGTVLDHLFQAAPLRALFPAPDPGEPPVAALANTAGGLAGGDSLRIAVSAGTDALATVCGAAAEKIYRSLGPETRIDVSLAVEEDAVLEWVPQETILFDGARLRRRTEAVLAERARLLAVEIVVFGRAAHGERLRTGLLHDAWRLRGADGTLIWADALRLDGNIAARLDAPFGFAGAGALGTLLFAGPDAKALIAPLRTAAEAAPALGGATLPRPGVLLARWLGDAAAVRDSVGAAIVAMRAATFGLPPRLPRLWVV